MPVVEREERIVVSPGPVHVPASRWEEIPPAHHRTGMFREIVLETESMIKELLGTGSPVYMMTASGTGAMEAAIANMTVPGSRVLVVTGGKFGDRWVEIGDSYGCRTEVMRFAPGQAVDIDAVIGKVNDVRPSYVAVTHVESSTGLLLPLQELMLALPEPRPITIVDAIASMGVEELEMDAWGIDVVAGACQKAFAAPPGVSFLCVGKRAYRFIEDRPRALYYFSLHRYEQGRGEGDTPFTPAIQMIQMMHRSLTGMKGMGWDRVRERFVKTAKAFIAAAQHISLRSLSENPSSAVQALLLPERCWGKGVVERLASDARIIAADGQGPLKGKIVRTGFLGLYGGKKIQRIVTSLGNLLIDMGCEADLDAASRSIRELSDQTDLFGSL